MSGASHRLSGKAVVLAAFGTMEPVAMDAYRSVASQYRREFPDTEIVIAFASDSIRRQLDVKGTQVPGPLKALAELHERSIRDVVVQPLQVVPGSEFHDLASLVMGLGSVRGKNAFRSLCLGLPLLAETADYEEVSRALGRIGGISDENSQQSSHNSIRIWKENVTVPEAPCATGQSAMVLMGHGTSHPADCIYARMAGILERDHGNVFLGTIDGYPSFNDVLARIKRAGVNQIDLRPFLLVAGGHAARDMAGDDPGSWKSMLEDVGLEVRVFQQGLLESDEIVRVFIRHTRQAVIEQQ